MSKLTESYIQELFAPVAEGNWQVFMNAVKDDVSWTVVNPNIKTMGLSGVYDASQTPHPLPLRT